MITSALITHNSNHISVGELEELGRGIERHDILYSDASFKGLQAHSSQGNAMLSHKDFPNKAITAEKSIATFGPLCLTYKSYTSLLTSAQETLLCLPSQLLIIKLY